MNSFIKTTLISAITFAIFCMGINYFLGENGLIGGIWENNSFWKFAAFYFVSIHLLIVSMSLSFHRYHTHKGLTINPTLDTFMQLHLWLVGGMSKLDWVSVHIYHHAYSDKPEDPHSPVQKGLLHVLFFGVADYTKAKSSEPVLKIRKTLQRNKLEQFIADHTLLGPVMLTFLTLVVFGPVWGSIVTLLHWSISPIFAVGGVNGLAHCFGYKNHIYHDNSRNLGFLIPLNFLIAGELDHNNHHARPKSCSFRHRWFEIDWGYIWIKVFSTLSLAKIKNAYTPETMKIELSKKINDLLEQDLRFKKKAEELAQELNTSYFELKKMIEDYVTGKKVQISEEVKLLTSEIRRTLYINYKLKLTY